jgi:hypothetical protein
MKDVQNAMMHLREHQEYPATKQQLVEACNSLSDFSDEDKKWFEENLPDSTYDSADEVVQALGMKTPPMNA